MGKMLFSFVGSSGSGKTTFVEKADKKGLQKRDTKLEQSSMMPIDLR